MTKYKQHQQGVKRETSLESKELPTHYYLGSIAFSTAFAVEMLRVGFHLFYL